MNIDSEKPIPEQTARPGRSGPRSPPRQGLAINLDYTRFQACASSKPPFDASASGLALPSKAKILCCPCYNRLMREREQHSLATIAAETMYGLWEMEAQREEPDLDAMMRRLKDLSAYSLTHAEILEQREGVEMLALAMFFGATSNPAFHRNQARLQELSEETVAYEGRASVIEEEVARRRTRKTDRRGRDKDEKAGPRQPRRYWR